MLAQLMTLFTSMELRSEMPSAVYSHQYAFEYGDRWLLVDKKEVSPREYALLSSLLKEVASPNRNSMIEEWIQFLHGKGDIPTHDGTNIRITQLFFEKLATPLRELEEAVQAFFEDNLRLVPVSTQLAFLVEKVSAYVQTEEDYLSFAAALESDFFIKTKLYIGKFYPVDHSFPAFFKPEKDLFAKGLSLLPNQQIFTMESIFPSLLIQELPGHLQAVLQSQAVDPISHDEELLKTVRTFFENGFNASVTSEKLHIHRNTLQYRLSKFQEKTGIAVRKFDGALIAYFASLLADR
ncbi:CdaR family transcriptional regulator [Sporosarcina sp. Te-1]|uniref:PucR family transcriptional regulator n=1 Tax=Sporosarcina sp. Te-1 TaxID=2818390 RepID=UPI001A9F00BE|nr:helix-turn-helix domain-containing protein [Sporosarcina sp. Te-1]QTD40976.1 helix-turn-helix domain-containing protein [Sporosarcina sp. Te-1]